MIAIVPVCIWVTLAFDCLSQAYYTFTSFIMIIDKQLSSFIVCSNVNLFCIYKGMLCNMGDIFNVDQKTIDQ